MQIQQQRRVELESAVSHIMASGSVDLEPARLIPLSDYAVSELTRIKKELLPDDATLCITCVRFLENVIKKFSDTRLMTAERVALGLCLLDILDMHADLYAGDVQAFKKNLHIYLSTVFNATALTSRIRNDTKKKIQVDSHYLPNTLPAYLSAPRPDQDEKNFLRLRYLQYYTARDLDIILPLIDEHLNGEAIPKDVLSFFRDKTRTKHRFNQLQKLKSVYREITDQYKKNFPTDGRGTYALDQLKYMDLRERDLYHVFINDGKFYSVTVDVKNPSTPMKIIPAATDGLSSHGKEGWAAFVISRRGEVYMGEYKEGVLHHSSFLSGGNVLFSGEIKINANGILVGVTSYSGHYMPSVAALALCCQFFKDRGVEISDDCVFKAINMTNHMEAFDDYCKNHPGFEKKIDDNDPEALRIASLIIYDNMDSFAAVDLLAFAANKIDQFKNEMKLIEDSIHDFHYMKR